MKFFAQLADDMGVSASDEDVEAMSGEDAKATIARIMGNKKHSYFKGDKRAVERVAKLHERAYPGSTAA